MKNSVINFSRSRKQNVCRYRTSFSARSSSWFYWLYSWFYWLYSFLLNCIQLCGQWLNEDLVNVAIIALIYVFEFWCTIIMRYNFLPTLIHGDFHIFELFLWWSTPLFLSSVVFAISRYFSWFDFISITNWSKQTKIRQHSSGVAFIQLLLNQWNSRLNFLSVDFTEIKNILSGEKKPGKSD